MGLVVSITVASTSAASAGSAGSWCASGKASLAILGASSETGYGTTGYPSGGRWPVTTGAVADLAKTQPALVIIDLGGNEYWTQVAPAVFESNLRTMIAYIRIARPGVDIMLYLHEEISWPTNGNVYWPQPRPRYPWSQYAGGIVTVASTLSTGMVDMRQFINPSKGDPAGLWSADGIHLNDLGQSVVNGAWWDRLAASC